MRPSFPLDCGVFPVIQSKLASHALLSSSSLAQRSRDTDQLLDPSSNTATLERFLFGLHRRSLPTTLSLLRWSLESCFLSTWQQQWLPLLLQSTA